MCDHMTLKCFQKFSGVFRLSRVVGDMKVGHQKEPNTFTKNMAQQASAYNMHEYGCPPKKKVTRKEGKEKLPGKGCTIIWLIRTHIDTRAH